MQFVKSYPNPNQFQRIKKLPQQNRGILPHKEIDEFQKKFGKSLNHSLSALLDLNSGEPVRRRMGSTVEGTAIVRDNALGR